MKKITKTSILVLLLLFLISFINRNNYYESSTILSDEAIKEFEKDLKAGKEINPKNYLNERKNYDNKLSLVFMNLSKSIEFIVNKSLRKVFSYLNSWFNFIFFRKYDIICSH